MTGENSTPKGQLVENAELALKAGTIVLGLLYVIGLLVSNVQLMEVGVADFASLQARNIMTGFLFAFYCTLLAFSVTPLAIGIYHFGRTIKSQTYRLQGKAARCFGIVVAAIFAALTFAYLAGTALGWLYPWGVPWVETYSWAALKWEFQTNALQEALAHFSDAFLNPYIVVPLGALLYSNMTFPLLEGDTVEAPLPLIAKIFPLYSWFSGWRLGILLMVSPILLIGFAREVYPNIRYNLGGGQPDVAELQISTDKASNLKLPGISACCRSTRPGDVLMTDPMVIWYQSDKFLYLAPLSRADDGEARLVALDIRVVRTIHYLSKSVRIGSGGRILSVQSD